MRRQDLLSVDNDNGREGENGNRSIAFMMNVKCDPSGAPAAKKKARRMMSDFKRIKQRGRRRKRENLEVWQKSGCEDV